MMKPHSIRRAAALLTERERLEGDLLKIRNAQYEGRIWDATVGEYMLCADMYWAATTDERMAEIIRSGLIADKQKEIADIDVEFADLQHDEPLLAPFDVPDPAPQPQESAL